MKTKTINLEKGFPSIEDARKRLIWEIEDGRKNGIVILKIIHGYGSSGLGGTLQQAIRNSLKYRKKEGKIESYLAGEKFSVFNESARNIIEKYPQLKSDPDFNRENFGISIAVLNLKLHQ